MHGGRQSSRPKGPSLSGYTLRGEEVTTNKGDSDGAGVGFTGDAVYRLTGLLLNFDVLEPLRSPSRPYTPRPSQEQKTANR